jgi:hypothetical protein
MIISEGGFMFRNARAHFVPSVAQFAIAYLALWCGLGEPLAAHDTPVDTSKPVIHANVSSNQAPKSTYSNMPTPAVKSVAHAPPPISCKVGAKGVLIDCRVNDGYNLDDVANWFQDDHDRTLQLAVNSVTLAKKFERSFESCADEK